MPKSLLLNLFASLHLLLTGISFTAFSHADTLVFEATTDFPVIDAGEVPYYKDSPARNALAINAAIENYRDKFARAEVVYDGQAGQFDMTIIGLAELDGAAVYNLLVNGEIVGTATNPSVVTDYTPIRHIFEDIDVPGGAILAVESLANSNDTVPEGEGFAFARGRWTALEMTSTEAAPAPSNYIDLKLGMDSDKQALTEGQEVIIILDASNAANSLVATSPLLWLTLPETGLAFVSGTNCAVISLLVECALSELAAGQQTSLSVTLAATSANPSANLKASIRADQTENYEIDNTVSLNFTIAEGQGAVPKTPSANTDANTPAEPGQNTGANRSPSEAGSLSVFLLLLLSINFYRMTPQIRQAYRGTL